MGRRGFPAVLLAVAAIADRHGSSTLARDALMAALPFAAVCAIAAFGRYLDRRDEALPGLQAFLWAVALALLVLSSEVRANAVHGVPPLAVSSLAACLVVLGVKGVLTAVPYARRAAELRPAKP